MGRASNAAAAALPASTKTWTTDGMFSLLQPHQYPPLCLVAPPKSSPFPTLMACSGPAPLALIGHSLGGKVALETIRLVQEQGLPLMPQQTWVLDSQPGAVDDDLGGVSQVLELVHVSASVLSVDAELQGVGRSPPLGGAAWLGAAANPSPSQVWQACAEG